VVWTEKYPQNADQMTLWILIALIFLIYSGKLEAMGGGESAMTIKPCPEVAPLLMTFKNR
jgi:hypothetical protein